MTALFLAVVIALANTRVSLSYLPPFNFIVRRPPAEHFGSCSTTATTGALYAKSNWLKNLEKEKIRRGLMEDPSAGDSSSADSKRNASQPVGQYERAEDWEARGAGKVDLGWEQRVMFDSRSQGNALKQNENLGNAIKGEPPNTNT